MSEPKNLVETLTDEILRVTEIVEIYKETQGGQLAAAIMMLHISQAKQAQASGDILQMIPALQMLQSYQL